MLQSQYFNLIVRMCLVMFYVSDHCHQTEQVELVNVALGKPTKQSSVDFSGYPYLAVDGNRNTNYWDGSCTHTLNINVQYWIVDLLSSYPIRKINITNRVDNEPLHCLNHFLIYVSENPDPILLSQEEEKFSGKLCLNQSAAFPQGGPHSLECESQDIHGRYVYVWKLDKYQLTLCEFEVFVDKNETLRKWNGLEFKILPGKKSSMSPFFTPTLERFTTPDCIYMCVSSDRGYTSIVQVEAAMKRCECIQEKGFEELSLDISDVGWTLMKLLPN